MHQPYEEILKHKADFRVKYKFRSEENGGRKQLPYQGLRSDFSYADDSFEKVYIIWPEFEDKDGNLILENDKGVPEEGTALMWVINPERRNIHRTKIQIGTKCFFREGVITADCEVIEIIDLFNNPL